MSGNGRKLIGPPVLLQDWDHEAEEGAAKYWELFLDLLMVAAASAVADGVKENPTVDGLQEFTVLFFLFVNAWMLYTHHMTARFEDGTFLHALILFIFIVGNGICIVNASFETARIFAMGALLQRASILIMLISVHSYIPRAQVFCWALAKIICLESTMLLLSIVLQSYAIPFLWMAVLVGLCLELIMTYSLKREDLVPINIEHTTDRLGILLLVMLGETVISATIEYRRLAQEEEIQDYRGYYKVLFWALSLVFFYTLLFFAMTPPPAYHASRRSRIRGCMLMICHKFMCGSVLAVGVCVKLTVEAVAGDEELSDFAIWLSSISVGCSLLFLYVMRLLHYQGVFPRGTEPPFVIRLMNVWWAMLGVACAIPFLGLWIEVRDPVMSIAMYAILLFAVCFIESSFTHVLEQYIIQEIVHHSDDTLHHLQNNDKVVPSYQSTETR